MKAILRTRTTGASKGFMKTLVGADDRTLGFTMIGQGARDVIIVVQTAMMADLPYTALRDAILTHPTTAERLIALFSKIPPG